MTRPRTSKTEYYGNCSVFSIDNELLFRCDAKKANWYLDRNLAKIIVKEPLSIQLNFKTNGNGHKDDPYYTQSLKSICVVCGTENELTGHHIVPISFRRYFPTELKDHSHYDILPVCIKHHDEYNAFAEELVKKLANEYDVPICGLNNTEYDGKIISKEEKLNINKCILYARLICEKHSNIPKDRIDIMKNYIKQCSNLNNTENYNYIKNIPLITYKVISCGKYIVSKLEGNIQPFIVMWRKHFIDTMKPQFMPKHWTIDKIEI